MNDPKEFEARKLQLVSKMPPAPKNQTFVIQDKNYLDAQKQARDLTRARILSPGEIAAQLAAAEKAKKEAAKAARVAKAAAKQAKADLETAKEKVKAEKPAKPAYFFKYNVHLLDGQVRRCTGDEGAKPKEALPTIKSTLQTDHSAGVVKIEDGVFLLTYQEIKDGPLTYWAGHLDYMATEAGAIEKGERLLADSEKNIVHYEVTQVLTKKMVMELGKAPARDGIKKRGPATRILQFNKVAQWQSVHQDRCHFSHG